MPTGQNPLTLVTRPDEIVLVGLSRLEDEMPYDDAQLLKITTLLDDLFLSGSRKDLASVIIYAAHRIEDMDSRLAEQIAATIAGEALAISMIGGGE